ncbi:MAG: hypothetical protein ACR9NN_01480 [Nostochopsis sp.]
MFSGFSFAIDEPSTAGSFFCWRVIMMFGRSLSIPVLLAACADRVRCKLHIYSIFEGSIAFAAIAYPIT